MWKTTLSILCILAMFLCWGMLLIGCSSIRHTAYNLTHTQTEIVDPQDLDGATIVYSDGTRLPGVIDLEYDKENQTVHYTRKETGKFVKGVLPYTEITIYVGDGVLIYDSEWKFVNDHGSYLIHQDLYKEIYVES